jgi:hypothetical protein
MLSFKLFHLQGFTVGGMAEALKYTRKADALIISQHITVTLPLRAAQNVIKLRAEHHAAPNPIPNKVTIKAFSLCTVSRTDHRPPFTITKNIVANGCVGFEVPLIIGDTSAGLGGVIDGICPILARWLSPAGTS